MSRCEGAPLKLEKTVTDGLPTDLHSVELNFALNPFQPADPRYFERSRARTTRDVADASDVMRATARMFDRPVQPTHYRCHHVRSRQFRRL